MGASDPDDAILLTDSVCDIKRKIMTKAFSGGKSTITEHREQGADLSVDVSFEYLTVFLESDDELESIRREYQAGVMLTGEIKKKTVAVLNNVIESHRRNRKDLFDIS